MKILVIGHSYVVDSNRQFWNQVAKHDGVSVDIVVPKDWSSNLIKKLQFSFNQKTDSNFNKIFPIDCYYKGNGSLYFYNWLSLFKIFKYEKYDLVFLFQETWALSTAQVSFIKAMTLNRSSLYYLAVCQNIIKNNLSWVIPWEKMITCSVDRILYCTKEIIDVLDWKKIKTKTAYLPFTYDQNIYDFKYKKNTKEFVIGYLGRLTEEKGIKCLVEACRKLNSENIKVKLVLAGDGPLRGIEKEDYIKYTGPFKHTEAHLFYHDINLFVLPSETRKFWKEQFGRVLVESVASGTPVIGSSSGAIPEVLGSLNLDYIFKEASIEDLVRVIKKIMSDMDNSDFLEKMLKANELNLFNFSHEYVGKKVLDYVSQDLGLQK